MGWVILVMVLAIIGSIVLLVGGGIAFNEGRDDGRRVNEWRLDRYDNGYWLPWAFGYDLGYNYGLKHPYVSVKTRNRQRFKRD